MTGNDDDLIKHLKSPGWNLETGKDKVSGTLEDVVRAAHERKARGAAPGMIRRIENTLELDALQLEKLWMYLGLPM